MVWSLVWSDRAKKQLNKLDKKIRDRIVNEVESIKEDPFIATNRLVKSKCCRLRVGDYRVIMDLQQSNLVIYVIGTGNRKRIYK